MQRKATLVPALGIWFMSFWTMSCNSTVRDISEYNSVLNDASNGGIVSKSIAGVNISVKYLPPTYMVLRGARDSVRNFDSLLKLQMHTMTFLLTVGPDKKVDEKHRRMSVMYEGVNNYQQYAERVMSANFMMDQQIKLLVDGKVFSPVLTILESVYELSDNRSFVVAFSQDKAEELFSGREYMVIYDDPFFEMGKVQFPFAGNKLRKLEEIKIE